ncbi:MAG: Fe-S cluster assembly protein SufD [Candidatus Nitrotoga sp.]
MSVAVTHQTQPAKGYLATLLAGRLSAPGMAPHILTALQVAAVERVSALSVPSTRDEEWRFTDISLLTKLSFQPVTARSTLQLADIARFIIAEAGARLVFVDGVYAPHLSRTEQAAGVTVTNLAHILEKSPAHADARVAAHLGQLAEYKDNVFAALNTACMSDAALVLLARDTAVRQPIHLLFIATKQSAVSYPRCLIRAEAGSTATVVEDYVSLQDEAYFTNAVSEVSLADDAQVHHIRVQREGMDTFHIANCAVTLARGSCYRSVSVATGARISRYNLNVLQAAEGGECTVDGLALIAGRQLADTHTCVDHAKPHGISRQLHKCIIGGSAHAVFNGKIMVRPGAQRADSQQTNRNLLLTSRAQVDTKPQLEIFADDVKCTHGATVSQLDGEEVFYLQSRGLTDAVARNLLTYAFGAEILERIPVASLKHQLERAVLEQTGIKQTGLELLKCPTRGQ